jgi:hypothetical protein
MFGIVAKVVVLLSWVDHTIVEARVSPLKVMAALCRTNQLPSTE